jgi:hypothetical protein
MATKSTENWDLITYTQTQVRLDTDPVKAFIGRMVEEGHITEAQSFALYKEIPMNMISTKRKDPQARKPWQKPDMRNATLEGIIEMLGQTREEMSNLKKTEGFLKERLMAELRASGDADPSEAPPMEDWLKEKIARERDD